MFVSVSEFLQNILPRLIAGKTVAHAVFTTYNAVSGYKDGAVVTGKPGLSAEVYSGGYSPPLTATLSAIKAMSRNELRVAESIINEESGLAGMAQHIVEQSMKENSALEFQRSGQLFSVVYAGLHAFEEAIDFSCKFKREHPASYVVVLTCDCDIERKKGELQPHINLKELDVVVVTRKCGGYSDMRDLLEGLIAAWPQ